MKEYSHKLCKNLFQIDDYSFARFTMWHAAMAAVSVLSLLFPRLTFTAPRFVLFSSRDSVGGGPYVIEAAYPLG